MPNPMTPMFSAPAGSPSNIFNQPAARVPQAESPDPNIHFAAQPFPIIDLNKARGEAIRMAEQESKFREEETDRQERMRDRKILEPFAADLMTPEGVEGVLGKVKGQISYKTTLELGKHALALKTQDMGMKKAMVDMGLATEIGRAHV